MNKVAAFSLLSVIGLTCVIYYFSPDQSHQSDCSGTGNPNNPNHPNHPNSLKLSWIAVELPDSPDSQESPITDSSTDTSTDDTSESTDSSTDSSELSQYTTIFKENLNTDGTKYITLIVDVFDEKTLSKPLIDSIISSLESVAIHKTGYEKINGFSIDMVKRFYSELGVTLCEKTENPDIYYPNDCIQDISELKFRPVWSGTNKCTLVTNTPYRKWSYNEGNEDESFRSVERVLIFSSSSEELFLILEERFGKSHKHPSKNV